MRGTEMPYQRSAMTMARNSETLVSKPFAMTWFLNTRMVLWKGKTEPCVRWLGQMLDEHRTPRRFWAKAVNITCYVSNRI
jgi:hypothetical protein